MSVILEKTKNFVSELLSKKLTEKHLFHNLEHTIDVVEETEEIANNSDVSKADLELLLIAAWFHDTGHTETYEGHEEVSCRLAREFLEKESYPEKKIEQIFQLIQTTKREHEPANQMEAI